MVSRLIRRPIRSTACRALGAAIVLWATFVASPMPALAEPAKARPRAANAVLAECSWDRPGHNPFMGDIVAAIDRYADIPPPVRSRLKQRMARREYDEIVSIRRDEITGKQRYGSEIRDMHFGAGSVCSTVTRARWSARMQERGLVYCESGQCILVPTVCRNVSRIVRRDAAGPVASAGPGAGSDAGDEPPYDPAGAGTTATPSGAAVPDAIGAGGGADSFAARSADVVPSPLFAGSRAAPGSSAAARAGPVFEVDAAEPGRVPVTALGWPAAAPPEARPIDLSPAATAAVPEPSTWLMLGAGLALLGSRRGPWRVAPVAGGRPLRPRERRAAHSPTAR